MELSFHPVVWSQHDSQLLDGAEEVRLDGAFPDLQRVIVTIKTTDGREVTNQLDYPMGDPRNPLSDETVERKFDALASPVLSEARRAQVKETVWNLEKLTSVSELMGLLKAGE